MPLAIFLNPLSLKRLIDMLRIIELFSGLLSFLILEASSPKVTSLT